MRNGPGACTKPGQRPGLQALAAFCQAWAAFCLALAGVAMAAPPGGGAAPAAAVGTAGATPAASAPPPAAAAANLERPAPKALQIAAAQLAEHPGSGQSAAWMLPDGHAALAARLLLAEQAERSLDLQYYIWHDDIAGALLFDALRQAADRGVKVRLLLDDNNTAGLDGLLTALDEHAGIEVRLFNANSHRRWRWLGYLTDFSRMNRRMHNKSMTADGLATIVGGRNVGDAYFGLGSETLFADLDVLAIGPVARQVTDDFERYWSSASVQAVGPLLGPAEPGVLQALAGRAKALLASPEARSYAAAMAAGATVQRMLSGQAPDAWAAIQVVSDDPAKGQGPVPPQSLLTFELAQGQQPPRRSLHLVSPYFVPGKEGMQWFSQLRARGVQVVVLTNSLSATDVAVVHSGYAKYRRELLASGVQLWELKRTASAAASTGTSAFGIDGSSSASLHAKTFLADCERIFVGSFNFDPRSARLNSEMGVTLQAPDLAKTMCAQLQTDLPSRAFRVNLRPDGQLEWWEDLPGGRKVWTEEPHTSAWQRWLVTFLSWLPVEWLL